MAVNFKTREISQGARKVALTSILIKKIQFIFKIFLLLMNLKCWDLLFKKKNQGIVIV
jgi:hypothetical protein